MVVFIITGVILYLIDTFLIGVLLAFWRLRWGQHLSRRLTPFVLMVIFAFLDTYWLPTVIALDLRIVIGNSRAAEALGVSGEVPLINLIGFGWFDVLVWGVQVIVAAWVADRLLPRGGNT